MMLIHDSGGQVVVRRRERKREGGREGGKKKEKRKGKRRRRTRKGWESLDKSETMLPTYTTS